MKVYSFKDAKVERLFYLASDLHFGVKYNCDLRLFTTEMDEAIERGARILLIGDIFDAIFPMGDKRHHPSLLMDKLAHRDDAPILAVAMMADILQPYKENIDMISLGNHEYAVYKYHGIDMIRLLIMHLNQGMEHKIKHGGYTGYLGYRFKSSEPSTIVKMFTILYHHGAGGAADINKGMTAINRKETKWDYDMYIFGHKHNRFTDADVRMRPIFDRSGSGYIVATDVRNIQIGNFYRSYPNTNGESGLPSYETIKEYPPKPLGGTFVQVRLDRRYLTDIKKDELYFRIRAEV